MYDVIIIGAGPAGLFAAYALRNKKVLIIEKGKPIENRKCPLGPNGKCPPCEPCNILSGIGGAGLFSDGKLNFIPKLGMTDLNEYVDEKIAQHLIDKTEAIFSEFGMDGVVYPTDMETAINIREKAKKAGIDLLLIKQKHMGSDKLPEYIGKMILFLKQNGVEILTEAEVKNIIVKDNVAIGVETNKGIFNAPKIIAAPGRVGSKWMYEQAKKLNIKVKQRGIEVGVRVEVPKEIMDPITNVIYDPTFFIMTDTYDEQVRTFCTNEGGFVTKENYFDFVCVNGHAYADKKSKNTNFALLSKVVLTEPVTDNHLYGNYIGNLATLLGNGKPLIQRYVDLKRGRRSTAERISKSYVKPTMEDAVPGDISMALTRRVLTNIMEAIEKLDVIMPGIASNSTLLYAPEIKFFSGQIETNKHLETCIKGLFVAGDGAGAAGNIVGAAATGLIAANNIDKVF